MSQKCQQKTSTPPTDGSFYLDVGGPNYRPPFLDLGRLEVSQCVRCLHFRFGNLQVQLLLQPLTHDSVCKRLAGRGTELCEYLFWCPLGCPKSEPRRHVE